MANGSPNSTGGSAVIFGAVVAGLLLASPLVVRFMDSGPRALDREVSEGVERVERTLASLDGNLTAIGGLRDRLSGAGVDFSSQPPQRQDAEADSSGGLRSDRLIAASERNTRGWLGAAPSVRAPQLAQLISANDQLVQSAEKQIAAVLALKSGDAQAADNIWANRAAVLTALARGRVNRDRAWLDRQDAAAFRGVAYEQLLEAMDLKRRATAAAERSPAKTVEAWNALRAQLEQGSAAAAAALQALQAQVQERRAKIAELRGTASKADAAVSQLESARSGAGDFRAYRQQVEKLSEQSRQAEYQADQLEFGAMTGGTFVPDENGDLLAGKYDGTQAAPGLVELDARRAALEQTVARLKGAVSDADVELAALNKTAQEIESQGQALTAAAEARTAALKATLKQIDERMTSAEKAEQSAVEAYIRGSSSISKVQTAARKRQQEATNLLREGGERKSERLLYITGDADTSASVETLGATLGWSMAEVYVQAMLSQEAQTRLLESAAPLGVAADEAGAAKVTAWRNTAAEKLADAARHLKTAKDLLAGASYDNVAGQRVSGANYKWQVSQLEGAVQMLAAVLADSPDSAEAARAQARALLQEALQSRETSPLLANAAAALDSLGPAPAAPESTQPPASDAAASAPAK